MTRGKDEGEDEVGRVGWGQGGALKKYYFYLYIYIYIYIHLSPRCSMSFSFLSSLDLS